MWTYRGTKEIIHPKDNILDQTPKRFLCVYQIADFLSSYRRRNCWNCAEWIESTWWRWKWNWRCLSFRAVRNIPASNGYFPFDMSPTQTQTQAHVPKTPDFSPSICQAYLFCIKVHRCVGSSLKLPLWLWPGDQSKDLGGKRCRQRPDLPGFRLFAPPWRHCMKNSY